MGAMTKPSVQEYEAGLLARSEKFVVSLRLGPNKVLRHETDRLAKAVREAHAMNGKSVGGRQAIIYGITPEGRQVFVPYQPAL